MGTLTTSAAIVCSLAAVSMPAVRALGDIVQTQNRLQTGGPIADFRFGSTIFQSGDLTSGDALGIFQQTVTQSTSGQLAYFNLQTAMSANATAATVNNVAPGGIFYNAPWTLNVFMFDAGTFSASNPAASLIMQQAVNTLDPQPPRIGTFGGSGSRTVFQLPYQFYMPTLPPGVESQQLYIGFAPERSFNGEPSIIFDTPASRLTASNPDFLAEGLTDFRYRSNPTPLLSPWLLGFPSSRMPFSLDITTVPSPGTGLVALTAAAFVAGYGRRRRE